MFKVGILTVSDSGARGEREDESGRVIREMVEAVGGRIEHYQIIPDDQELIVVSLKEMTERLSVDVVLTTGGTGLGPRDVTPDATLEVIDKAVPGIPEAMRTAGMQANRRAMLSRAVAGVRLRALIINLPGSPRGVRESLGAIVDELPHAIEILRGEPGGH